MELADDLLDGIPAIAKHIGKTERATYHLHYRGLIPTFKIGGRIHGRKSQMDAALRADAASA